MGRWERLRRWVFDHSPIIAFHSAGLVVALIAGIVLGAEHWGAQVSEVVAAFLGASMTVFGAIAYGEHQEARRKLEAVVVDLKQRRDMVQTCFDFLGEIGRATTMAMVHLDENRPVSDAIRPLVAQWETVSAFEPFKEVGNFFQIRSMLQIGAKCRNLKGFSAERTPHPRDARGRLLEADDYFGTTAAALVNAIEEDCRRTLPVFHTVLEELDELLRPATAP